MNLISIIWKLFSTVVSLQKWLAHFFFAGKIQKISQVLNLENRQYLPHYWLDKGFKGTFLNRALPSLHGGSLWIMLTVLGSSVQPFWRFWKQIDTLYTFVNSAEDPLDPKHFITRIHGSGGFIPGSCSW